MTIAAHLRFSFNWHIGQDPVEVTLTRVRKVRAGGGWTEETTTHGPYRARVAAGRSLPTEFLDQHAGQIRVDHRYVLLLPHTADARVDEDLEDTFAHARWGRFRIESVTDSQYQGVRCGRVCELERISQ